MSALYERLLREKRLELWRRWARRDPDYDFGWIYTDARPVKDAEQQLMVLSREA